MRNEPFHIFLHWPGFTIILQFISWKFRHKSKAIPVAGRNLLPSPDRIIGDDQSPRSWKFLLLFSVLSTPTTRLVVPVLTAIIFDILPIVRKIILVFRSREVCSLKVTSTTRFFYSFHPHGLGRQIDTRRFPLLRYLKYENHIWFEDFQTDEI